MKKKVKTGKSALVKGGKLTKVQRDACEFDEFGVWGFTNDGDREDYVPPSFSLNPLPPTYWHELPPLITPAQWERTEVNRLNALNKLYENGHIGYDEKEFRSKKRLAL